MLKDLLKQLDLAEKETNRIDEMWENDPNNTNIEKLWDKAYKKENEITNKTIKYIIKLTGIDEKIAHTMITKYRKRLYEIAQKEV